MSLMQMPARTTRPPLRAAFSAKGTRSPTVAKMIALRTWRLIGDGKERND
jgi:hypothetical protein